MHVRVLTAMLFSAADRNIFKAGEEHDNENYAMCLQLNTSQPVERLRLIYMYCYGMVIEIYW